MLAASLCALFCLVSSEARADGSRLPPEIGWNYGEIETPRAAAMGGAIRATANPTDGLFFNPANMAVQRVYHLGVLAQIWPEARRQSYGASAVDSIVSSTRMAGGLGGTWTTQDSDGINRTAKDLRFALAFPFSEQFFLGVGGRYLWLQQDGNGPLGDSIASSGNHGVNFVKSFSFDAGATLKPNENFAISLVGQNLTAPGTGYQPTSVGGGFGFGNENFTIEADALGDFTTWGKTTTRVMTGAELLAGDHYPLRVGYRWDQGAQSHALSGGVGYVDRSFSIDVAVRRTVAGEPATAVVFGFKYHMESSGLTPSASDF